MPQLDRNWTGLLPGSGFVATMLKRYSAGRARRSGGDPLAAPSDGRLAGAFRGIGIDKD